MENNYQKNENNAPEFDSLDILYGKNEMTKKEKIKNFLYYNKFTIAIVLVAAVIIGILVNQTVSRTNPDVTILYAGRYYIDPESSTQIKDAVGEVIGVDLNGDGKIFVQLIARTIKTADKQQQEQDESDELLYDSTSQEDLSMFRTELMAGESVICFIDENLYKTIDDKERFVDLSTLFGKTPESAIDDYAIYLKDIPLSQNCASLKTLGGDTVVCIKKRIVTMDQDVYNNNLEAFKKFFQIESSN